MNIKDALKETGWKLCEFKGDGDDECSTCRKPIPKGDNVYYERTCYESDEGEYHCEPCTIDTPNQWAADNESWQEFVDGLSPK